MRHRNAPSRRRRSASLSVFRCFTIGRAPETYPVNWRAFTEKNTQQGKVEDPIMTSPAITLWIYIQPDRNKIAAS